MPKPKSDKSDSAFLTDTSTLQRKAALKAELLLSQMGPQMQMEDSPRYRENMLGKPSRFPMTSVAEPPMRKLDIATALARDVRTAGPDKRKVRKASGRQQGGF